jgi:hypothetical protein
MFRAEHIDRNCDVLPLSFDDFFELKSYNININIFYKQADRSFTVPILEGTNRYKGVVHKIHARGPLRSAHVKKYSHCEYIDPPTFIGIQ